MANVDAQVGGAPPTIFDVRSRGSIPWRSMRSIYRRGRETACDAATWSSRATYGRLLNLAWGRTASVRAAADHIQARVAE